MSSKVKKPASGQVMSAFEMKIRHQSEQKLRRKTRSRSKDECEGKKKRLKGSDKLKEARKMPDSVDSNENLTVSKISSKKKTFSDDGLVGVVSSADDRTTEIRTIGCKKRKGQKFDTVPDVLSAKKGRKSQKNEDIIALGQPKRHYDSNSEAVAKLSKKSNEDRLGPAKMRRDSNPDSVSIKSAEKPMKTAFQRAPDPSARKALYRLPGAGRSETLHGDDCEVPDCGDLRCVSVEGGVVLVLSDAASFSMQGRALVTVLQGYVTLYGHKISPDSQPVKVVSPTCSSLVTLTCNSEGISGKSHLLKSCKNHGLSKNDCEQIWSLAIDSCVVLYLKKLRNPSCDFVTKVFPFQTLFNKSSSDRNKEPLSDVNDVLRSVGVMVNMVSADNNTPVLTIPEDFVTIGKKWDELLKTKDAAPKLLTCGGKNSGKSTFNRFMINSILRSAGRVCYLDCDVGQTEFTPPGCVALHIVEEPVLGPPFSHQTDPYFMCYFGPVTPADNPRLYSRCVQAVCEQYERLEPKPPLLINTMGWNKGLGVNLLIDTCHMTRPDMVVQLECMNQANNFPAITSQFVSTSPGWIYNRDSQGTDRFNHELTIIDSPVVPRIESQFRFHARELRELSTLGYFSRCLEPGDAIQSAPTYRVPWANLAIHTSHMSVPSTKILAAINASIVALCVGDLNEARRPVDCPDYPLQFDRTPVCQCLGFGIVRGIDPVQRALYILTPLHPGHLGRVNTLIRGASNIPDQLLLKQKCDGAVPYVDSHISLTGASSVRPRRYMPRRGREQATPD